MSAPSSRAWKVRALAFAASLSLIGTSAVLAGSPAGASNSGTIVLGQIDSVTGVQTWPDAPGLAQAWAKWTNAHGGINGHNVKVITLDDAGDPAKSLDDAQTLIQGDHAQAIVGSVSEVGSSVAAYIQKLKFPLIGGVVGYDEGANNPYVFPSSTTQVAQNYAVVDAGHVAGAKKVALLYCSEVAACEQVKQPFEQYLPSFGGSMVYSTAVSATAPSYTAPCLAAKDSGADGLDVAQAAPATLAVIQACEAQGWKPVLFGAGLGAQNNFKNQTALQGYADGTIDFQEDQRDTSAQKAFGDAIAKYDPSILHAVDYGSNLTIEWAGLQLYAAAAKAGNLSPSSTPAQVVDSMYKLPAKTTLGGLTPPLTFKRGDSTHLVNCFFINQIENHKWTQPYGAAPKCMPNSKS